MSDLHPHALTLDDQPLQDGDVAAQALKENIAALKTPDHILHLRCSAPADMDSDLLIGAGFVQVGMTRLIDIGLPLSDLADAPGLTYRWHLPDASADWPVWYQAHWDSYRRTHPINIAKDPGAARYPAVFGGEDLREALFVYEDNRLTGFSSLRADQDIGWIDTTQPDQAVLRATLAATLRRATACGWTHASLEVDDDHPILWEVAADFADHPQQDFIMWQRSIG